MFIQTDIENNIIQLVTIGDKPEKNGYEIPDDTPIEILKNIFNYKYINNELIINENDSTDKLKSIKDKKISVLSKLCNQIIIKGIDFNNEHYSLNECDQINLSKLESLAKDGEKVLYHANGKKCRIYEPEEFLQLTSLAFVFINYNTTYFNLLKSEIENMSSLEEVLSVNYGIKLNEENQAILNLASAGLTFSIPEIVDSTNYDDIINSNNNIDQLIEEANNHKLSQNLNNELAKNEINEKEIDNQEIISGE